jgi:predicted acetyltransferase
MTIEIRRVPKDQLRSLMEAVSAADSEELTDEVWRDIEPTFLADADRALGAYDGDRIVGGGGAFTFGLTVPGGGVVAAGGVTAVGVMPTHRRRGILRQLMARQLADIKAAGEPLAILWASESSIYQRFGYGLSTLTASIDLDRDRSALRGDAEAVGTVRLVELDEAARLFPPIYEANRARTPGFFTRTPLWWDIEVLSDLKWNRRGMDRKFYALHERDGRPDAYAMYRVRHEWPEGVPASELFVQEIMALDGDALRQMWRYILGVDLIKRIKTRASDPNEPLLHMLLEPRRLWLRERDGLWLRIVDVRAALEGRNYAADGSVVLEVRDEFMPDAAGRWRLTTSGGEGRVEPSSDPAELVLDTNDLAAAYLGAFTLADLARAGRTDELAPEARARADAMLAWPVRAWCPQIF